MRKSARKIANNRLFKLIKRDIPTINFETKVTATGKTLVIMTDSKTKHREIAYLKNGREVNEAKNELAISYMTKFNTSLDVMRVGHPNPSKAM